MSFSPHLITKNYTRAIEESSLDISLPDDELLSSIKDVMESTTAFASFKENLFGELFENSTPEEREFYTNIVDKQRQVLLTESTTVMASPEAMAFAVASFPMLIDLYAEPLLGKAITVYPYDKPLLTIPRIKWIAIHVDELGNTTEFEYPTATKNIRLNTKVVSLGANDNVYKGLDRVNGKPEGTIEPSEFRISARNARITKAVISVDGGADQELDIFGIFDAKGNFFMDDIYEASWGGKVYRIQGNLTISNGRFTWGVTDVTPADITSTTVVVFKKLEFRFKLFGNGVNKAVNRTKPLMSTVEVNCDLEESWEISEIEEILQDWKALWNMDVLSLLKDHIKEQMKLNKDAEIADLLYGNIPAAKKYGLYREFDLTAFMAGAVGSTTRPTNVMDIFKNIYPIFVDLIDQMKKRIKMEPKYIICGTKAGSVLKSLQQFETSLVGQVGEIGQVKGVPAINKFEIIISDTVEEDLIHMVTKSEQYNLSTILEVTYKPLYVIVETTNSKRRTFIKSRGWIGIVRNEGIATIKVKNFNQYFGIVA